jgi:hypothetical protein
MQGWFRVHHQNAGRQTAAKMGIYQRAIVENARAHAETGNEAKRSRRIVLIITIFHRDLSFTGLQGSSKRLRRLLYRRAAAFGLPPALRIALTCVSRILNAT